MHHDRANTSYPTPAYAWYLVVLLTLAYSLAVIDRVSIGLLAQPIQSDLNLSDTQFGMLHGLAFVLFLAVAGFPLGMAVDRWSRKKVLALGVLLLGLATLSSAFAGGFLVLFLFRVLVGAGDSSISPASSALIADSFHPQRRARAYGVYASGIAIGSGVAFMASAALLTFAEQLQRDQVWIFSEMRVWQVCFFLLGIPGILLSALILASIREHTTKTPKPDTTNQPHTQQTLSDFLGYLRLRKSVYLCLVVGVAVAYIAGNSFFSWYVVHLSRAFAYTPQTAGAIIGSITVPVGLCSALTSGLVTSWFYKSGRQDAPILTILIMIATSSSCLFGAAIAPNSTLSLTLFGLSAATVNWGFPSALTALNNITEPKFRGQITALFTLSLGVIGVGLGPVATGALSDLIFSGNLGYSLALVAVFSGVSGFVLVLRSRTKYLAQINSNP